jgi:hypothetical protein
MLVSLLTSRRYFEITNACLRGATYTTALASYYDLRYFYFDDEDVGHYTCGFVFQVMISLLRQRPDVVLYGQEWYSAVKKCKNPVVQGFLSEQICLSAIGRHGLKALDPSLGPMYTTIFEGVPVWDAFLQTGENSRLFLPKPFNFKAIDGVILQVDHKKKSALLYPIQITLSLKERDSVNVFYKDMWGDWIEPMMQKGYSVNSLFIFIDLKQPSDEPKPWGTRWGRSSAKKPKLEGGFSVVHLGIQQIDSELASTIEHRSRT